jgi:hypothetical protein
MSIMSIESEPDNVDEKTSPKDVFFIWMIARYVPDCQILYGLDLVNDLQNNAMRYLMQIRAPQKTM